MVEPQIRVMVFAGAGASCFANIPAVCSFFGRVNWPQSEGLSAACQELARRISNEEKDGTAKDWPRFDAEKLFGWLERWQQIGRIQSGSCEIKIPRVSEPVSVDSVMSHLRREIVRIYGSPVEWRTLPTTPYQSFFESLSKLTPQGQPMYVFTTNYDRILEQLFESWAETNEVFGSKLRVCTGFSSARPGRWQPELFSETPKPGEKAVHLVKLHGSTSWKMNGTHPVDTGWNQPTDQDCLLYFGYKSVPETEPFIKLHDLLKAELLRAEAAIVIGFRFGDPYIRELFDFALRANSRLRVMCSLTRPPEAESPLAKMMGRFPNRVSLLTGPSGEPLPFGDARFTDVLEQHLTAPGSAEVGS
jgi:hypothetical protein